MSTNWELTESEKKEIMKEFQRLGGKLKYN